MPSKGSVLLLAFAAHVLWAADAAPHQRAGRYDISLRLPADGLYAEEEMEIELHLEDTSRPDLLIGFAPVVRAAMEVRIDVPEMPAMPAYRETAHAEAAPGDYGVHPTFSHGGEFRLRISITPPDDTRFEVEFPLHVLDAGRNTKRKAHPTRYALELTSDPKRPKAGEPVELRLLFRDREDNPKMAFSAFETVHEALVHVVIVRSDLSTFAHEHPALGAGGIFRLRYTFPAGGEYHVFADVAPKRAGSQILSAKINVAGQAPERFDLNAQPAAARQTGRTRIALSRYTAPAKKTVTITAQITDASASGPPRDLEPYLGAGGHFLLVHQDGATFVHSHPIEDDAALTTGRLQFLVRLPKPGLYRGWLQVKRSGEVVTADFVLRADIEDEAK
jgi:hypothetical protein